VITTGAVMAFESAHGLTTEWRSRPHRVVGASPSSRAAPGNHFSVRLRRCQSDPSRDPLRFGATARFLFTTLVNTGIAVAPTAAGTYPVFARFLVIR